MGETGVIASGAYGDTSVPKRYPQANLGEIRYSVVRAENNNAALCIEFWTTRTGTFTKDYGYCYQFNDDGKVSGFNMDLTTYVARSMRLDADKISLTPRI
ncbi:MAG: hypothetical protein HC848_07025 [Limnobacter sp.]|nr:hypothetical protein [Limnobacter sp.]